MMKTGFCGNCGAPVDDTCRFCMGCGAPVDLGENTAQQEPVTVYVQPVGEDSYGQKSVKKQKRQKTKKTKKEHSQGRSFFGVFFGIILCVLIFALLTTGVCIVSVRWASTPLTIRRILESVDLMELSIGKTDSVKDWLEEKVLDPMDVQMKMEAIVNSDTVRIALSDKLTDYLEDFYFNTGKGEVTSEDILFLIEKLSDRIEKETGIDMGSVDAELLEESVEDFSILKTLSLNRLESRYELEYQVLRWGVSYYAVGGILVLCLLLLLLVNACNKKVFHHTISGTGWIFVVESAILLIAYYANTWIVQKLSFLISMEQCALVAAVSKGVLAAGLELYYVLGLLGLIFVLIGAILKGVRRRRTSSVIAM